LIKVQFFFVDMVFGDRCVRATLHEEGLNQLHLPYTSSIKEVKDVKNAF